MEGNGGVAPSSGDANVLLSMLANIFSGRSPPSRDDIMPLARPGRLSAIKPPEHDADELAFSWRRPFLLTRHLRVSSPSRSNTLQLHPHCRAPSSPSYPGLSCRDSRARDPSLARHPGSEGLA